MARAPRLLTQYSTPQAREKAQREEGQSRAPRGPMESSARMLDNLRQSQRPKRIVADVEGEREAERQRLMQARPQIRREGRQALYGDPAAASDPAAIEAYQEGVKQAARDALSADADHAARAAAFYTKAPESYVRTLIRRETAYTDNPRIRPGPLRGKTEPRSSAVGYGQFLDDDANRTLWRNNLPRYVMGAEDMTDEERMAYREDGPISAAMIGHRANADAAALMGALGRRVTQGEVYLAHWAGSGRASKILLAKNQNASAASLFSDGNWRDTVENHRDAFYDKSGHARSVKGMVEQMTAEFGRDLYPTGAPE